MVLLNYILGLHTWTYILRSKRRRKMEVIIRKCGKIHRKLKISQYSSNCKALSTSQNENETFFTEQRKINFQENFLKIRPNFKLKDSDKITKAAVLVPMCTVRGQPAVLFTLRSNQLYNHRGEVSFPGGKMDAGDADIIDTALRETEEELGLLRKDVNVWGTLHPMPSKKDIRNMVTPVIAFCGEIDESRLKLNPAEVESTFTRTIHSLNEHANYSRFRSSGKISSARFKTRGGYAMPVYLGGDNRIWGLTALFLHQALSILAPDVYTFKLKFTS